jgi:hypothetical protein
MTKTDPMPPAGDGWDALRSVSRTHDDCDGDLTQRLTLIQTPDGDIRLGIDNPPPFSGYLRFREPSVGGGRNPRTWKALVALFKAMEADNAKLPIR